MRFPLSDYVFRDKKEMVQLPPPWFFALMKKANDLGLEGKALISVSEFRDEIEPYPPTALVHLRIRAVESHQREAPTNP